MNIKSLKAESCNLKFAYFFYFTVQAPYASVRNWGYQILYWMVAYLLLASAGILFGGKGEIEFDFLEIMGLFVISVLLAIWPVNIFFALPNMVKKENLRLYEIMRNQK